MEKTTRRVLISLLCLVLVLFCIGYYYYVPDIPLETLNKKYGVQPSQYLEVEGMQVHYRVEGPETDSIPLVLLHGTGSSLFTWNTWTRQLKEQHKIIRLDLPGFGLTGPHPEGDYQLETYLEFMKSFLSRLGVKKCILAGNSLGGEIAWRYTLNNPEQVDKLILLDAAGYPVEVDYVPFSYVLLRIPIARELLRKITPPDVIRGSLEYLYGKPERITDEVVELYFDMTCREGNRKALTERMESIAKPAPYELIPTIETPTLILWGEKDELTPVDYAKRFHQDLPNSTLITFEDAGHMPMEEIPERSAEKAARFLLQDSSRSEASTLAKRAF